MIYILHVSLEGICFKGELNTYRELIILKLWNLKNPTI